MRRIQYWTLWAVVLLLCVSACSKRHQELSCKTELDVDEFIIGVHQFVEMDDQRQVLASPIFIYRYSPIFIYPNTHGVFYGWATTSNSNNENLTVKETIGGKEIVLQPNTLYFFRRDEKLFEKEYQELGIDAQQLTDDQEKIRDYLQPILEKLIRENVSPQEEKE